MLIDLVLDDGEIKLRCLHGKDVGYDYLSWLHDGEINRYLEIKHNLPDNVPELERFVNDVNQSIDSILFGIFLHDGLHIGNIKLGPINHFHKRADVGLILGDKRQWGKGYATRAIRLASNFAFEHLGLMRLTAGCYQQNKGSFRAFIKAGYQYEGRLTNYWELEGNRTDEILMGLSFQENSDPIRNINLGSPAALIFIGGGNAMLQTMQAARLKGLLVGAILAPRHASEEMISGKTLIFELLSLKIPVYIAEGVSEVSPNSLGDAFISSLALCFGPAWIFPDEVLSRFKHGMLNFNGIPIPQYLGGAHYTWQILNDHREAGCHIQVITSNLDRGDLLLSKTFQMPANAITLEDYFRENEKYAIQFLEEFLDQLIAGTDFKARSFRSVNNHRIYFPRLITTENGWIDWSWSGNEIAAFCRAFGAPYPGASTKLNGRRIYLKRVLFVLESSHSVFHPFCFGLIVRCLDNSFFIAVSGGMLRVDSYEFDGKDGAAAKVREGDRLYTDAPTLEHSRCYRPHISSDGNLTGAS